MADLVKQVLSELNQCRANPKQYSSKLEKTLKFYKGKMLTKPGETPIETEEGKENVQACIAYLKTQKPLPEFTYNSSLEKAAQDHIDDMSSSGIVGHVGSDGLSVDNRIERYAEWQGAIGENIDYGSTKAEDIVVNLLIDDGVMERGHRLNILNPDHVLVGIASGPHSEMDSAVVIVFAQSLIEKSDSQQPAGEISKTPAKEEPQNKAGKAEAKPPLVRPKEEPKGFDPTPFRRPGYTDQDIIELKEAFDLFDADKSGSIDPTELKTVIEDFGLDAKNAAIFQMIADMDTDGSGQIEFAEFLDMISGRPADENSMEEVRKVFNIFDTDKTGFITLKNLKQICNDLGEQFSDETLMNLIAKGDSNSDGLVSFEDFYYIMTRTVL